MRQKYESEILRQRGIFGGDFPGRKEFLEEVRRCQDRARKLFSGFDMTDAELPVVFVRSGRVAGMAKRRKNIFNLEFNVEAIFKDREEMMKNTIPHEMAHIVDMVLHGGKSSHGPRWRYIVRALGGSDERTHDIPVSKARRSRKFLYRATCGTEVEVGSRHHKMVQQGGRLIIRKTGGEVLRKGYTGRQILS